MSIAMIDQLHSLNAAQAKEVLDHFLATEREALSELRIGTVKLDHSPSSVAAALKYVAEGIKTQRLAREEIDIWIMRLGYYFGESLRQKSGRLFWGLGSPEYAFANHPAILGFGNGEEAEVITICRNVILSLTEDHSPPSRADDTVRFWFELAAQ